MAGFKEHHNVDTKAALEELELLLGKKRKTDKDIDINIEIMKSTLQMTKVQVKLKVADSQLADALSQLIGGLKQPDPQLFD